MPDTCFITHKKQLGVLRFGESKPLMLPLACSWEILLSLNEYFSLDEKEICAMIICGHYFSWNKYESYLKKDLSELKSSVNIICNMDEDDFYG